MPSKHFHEILDKMKEIHDRKSHDYASDSNPFSNFERSGEIAAVSPNVVFQVMIGIKIVRLEELLRGKEPKNESIEDSFIDLANYCVLWGAYYKSLEKEEAPYPIPPSTGREYTFYPIYGDQFPEICSVCNTGNKLQGANHAQVVHGAEFSNDDNALIYPDGRTAKVF